MRELAIIKENVIKKGQAINDGFKLNAVQLEQFSILERQIYNHATDELIKLAVDRQNAISKAASETAEANLKNISLREQSEIKAIEGVETPNDLTEVEFEERKQIAILEVQKKYNNERISFQKEELRRRRDVEITALNGELALIQGKEDKESEIKRKSIINNLKSSEEGYIAEEELLENTFLARNAEIDRELNKLNKKKPFSLAKLFGLDEDDVAAIKTALSQVSMLFNQLLDENLKNIDANIDASKKREQQIDSEIKELESNLEKEQQQTSLHWLQLKVAHLVFLSLLLPLQ